MNFWLFFLDQATLVKEENVGVEKDIEQGVSKEKKQQQNK